MQQNSKIGADSATTNSVSDFVKTIIDSYMPQLRHQSISIETDLESVKATFDGASVRSITNSLIENAINKMPNGGVISLTLIDGKHQWELEVADSEGMAFNDYGPAMPSNNGLPLLSFASSVKAESDKNKLPRIVPVSESESLRRAQLAATSIGGQIQIWDCPQGGTAHVFVAPKPRNCQPNFAN